LTEKTGLTSFHHCLQLELIDIYSTKRRTLAQCASNILVHQIHELSLNVDNLDSLNNLLDETSVNNWIDCRRTKDTHHCIFSDKIDDLFNNNDIEYMMDLNSFIKKLKNNISTKVSNRSIITNIINELPGKIINIGKVIYDIKLQYVQKYTRLIVPLAKITMEYMESFHTSSYAMSDNYNKIKLYLCVDNCLNICGGLAWPTNHDSFVIKN
jgi:hypothetical protein